jgi:hypothetical protein
LALELILRAGADRAAWGSGAPGWLVAALRDGTVKKAPDFL